MSPIRPLTLFSLLSLAAPVDCLHLSERPEISAEQSRGKRRRSKDAVLTPFLGDLSAAKKSSLERNVPLVVHMILENEPENDSYRDSALNDSKLTAASERAVVIIANNGEHELKTIKETIEGRQVESLVCSSYPWFTNCEQHRAPWDDLYIAFHDEAGDLKLPQTVILSPEGKISFHKQDGHPAETGEVLGQLQKAQKLAGPGFTQAELSQVKKLEKEALRSTEGKLWGTAWREWAAILEISETGVYADHARQAMPDLQASMSAQLESMKSGLVPGTAADTYAGLVQLRLDWEGTPLSSEISRLISRAERDKSIRDEIRAWRSEQEAQTLLEEAAELEKQGNEKGMRRALRKLFGKKYASTRAYAQACESYPQHAPKKKD